MQIYCIIAVTCDYSHNVSTSFTRVNSTYFSKYGEIMYRDFDHFLSMAREHYTCISSSFNVFHQVTFRLVQNSTFTRHLYQLDKIFSVI